MSPEGVLTVWKTLQASGLPGLGISGKGSVSPAQPAGMVITNGKSQWAKVDTALLGNSEEKDSEERLSSSSRSETSITVSTTNGDKKGNFRASVISGCFCLALNMDQFHV